jgi:hypothetical protein
MLDSRARISGPQWSAENETRKEEFQMSRPLVTNDWRKLSKAARNERDPKKFVPILKQLYDVVNEDQEKRSVNRGARPRQSKAARVQRELEAA